MKLLYSHRTRSADGQYVHIRELTDALRMRGHEIVMAGPGGEAGRRTKALNAGGGRSATSWLPAPLYECAEYGYSFAGYRRLSNLAKTSQPDIIYERYNLFYHAGMWLRRRAGLPLILEVNAPLAEERARHGDLALKAFARRSEAAIWRAADRVAPVTNVLAGRLRAAGVSDDKISVIQNGVSADFLTEPNPNIIRTRFGLDDKLVLGFTGFVRDWHKVDRVIRFLAQAGRNDLHFFLVGDGPAREALETLAAEMNVTGQMTVAGVVQREEMAAYVAAFDIALQPAVVDYASPLKLFEYMALGKPIIAPSSANICEVLTSGEDALLFAQQDGAAFDKTLTALIDDAELRARLGAAARASLIRQDFTWAGNARRVEAIAEKLIEKNNAHPYRD